MAVTLRDPRQARLAAMVLEHLAAGRTVAWVADRATLPRRDVLRIATEAGYLVDLGRDMCIPMPEQPAPTPGGLEDLVTAGEGSRSTRTRSLAAQLRSVARALEDAVVREQAQAQARDARADYDTRAVRAWALAQGLSVPARGRYLPADVVDAYRQAHR